MKKSLVVLLLAGVLSAVYAAKDISGYKLELTSAGNETNLLGDGSFEDGGKGWVAIDKNAFPSNAETATMAHPASNLPYIPAASVSCPINGMM